jgi:hypothetical protein
MLMPRVAECRYLHSRAITGGWVRNEKACPMGLFRDVPENGRQFNDESDFISRNS